jgi:hypothetical protein
MLRNLKRKDLGMDEITKLKFIKIWGVRVWAGFS